MKNRASLVLMEQLIMVLVFALTASICMQIFVGADRISRQTAQRDQAIVLAQNAAETVKARKGDLSAAAEFLGGNAEADRLTVSYEELYLQIQLIPASTPGLGQAQISVIQTGTGDEMISLTAGWQEVG